MTKTQICSKCNIRKPVSQYHADHRPNSKKGIIAKCKSCCRKISQEWRATHKDTRDRTEYRKTYYEKNKDKFQQWNKDWRKINDRSQYHREYRDKNPSARIACYCRNRIRNAIKNGYKASSSLSLTGCNNWNELKIYLESKFTDGMTWENMGQWHIDHVKPCSSFDLTDLEQQKECFHYTNLQPLWAKENLSKSNKY
jgi:hypothetical protein